MKRRVLFPRTGNSARNLPSEATLRASTGNHPEVFSAGSQPTEIREDRTAPKEALDRVGLVESDDEAPAHD